ncbi:MAG TPA: hypothetical protein VHG29_06845 [Novosphingobium sp.]|nr:hypothetical protein [Novosphingobium sp.]
MSEPRTFASLTPTLLARKGTAKPAMRPQLQPMPHYSDSLARTVEDDLGWNDMGHDEDHDGDQFEAEHESAEVVAINPATPVAPAAIPPVVQQQAAMAERVAAPLRKSAPERRSALSDGRRAAFTLRVDAERHLKLRLACTLRNRSAQQLVTDALDKLLSDLPEVTSLAAQVAGKR